MSFTTLLKLFLSWTRFQCYKAPNIDLYLPHINCQLNMECHFKRDWRTPLTNQLLGSSRLASGIAHFTVNMEELWTCMSYQCKQCLWRVNLLHIRDYMKSILETWLCFLLFALKLLPKAVGIGGAIYPCIYIPVHIFHILAISAPQWDTVY